MVTRSRWIVIVVRISVIFFSILLLGLASRIYRSEQLVVLAEGGRKTIQDYERLLRASVKLNAHNGTARLRLSDLELSQRNFDGARVQLASASPGRNHWRGWEREGALFERRAFHTDGTEFDISRAVEAYDKVLQVYPTYERGLERRSILALKVGDWRAVEKYAAQLEELDANNRNVIYMRGRAAEAVGRHDIAFHLYAQLNANATSSSELLYTQKDVIDRLSKLGKNKAE